MAALAYPDRIGLRRKGTPALTSFRAARAPFWTTVIPLAGARLIVVTDLDGNPREARIRQAIQITESAHAQAFCRSDQLGRLCEWSKRERRVIARQREC